MVAKSFIIQSESLGRGDDNLGLMLMANFLRLLAESEKKPSTIIFWNSGVKLVCDGSHVLPHLKKLEETGVEILACTTCLEYFELKDKQVVGKPTNMVKAIQTMFGGEVVTL